jgi:muconolactone D-isomerase
MDVRKRAASSTAIDAEHPSRVKADEKPIAQKLHDAGVWRHLSRIVGQYTNVSIFDVESPTHLHEVLSQLPLFPYIDAQVRALCWHPSSTRPDDQ